MRILYKKLIFLSLFGCRTEVEPTLSSQFSGNVTLYDEFGEVITENLSGTKIRLDDGQEVTTSENGSFLMEYLLSGVYNVKISRSGFIDFIDTITFERIDFNESYGLLEIPTTEISEITVSDKENESSNWLSFTISFKVAPIDENLYKRRFKINCLSM